MLIPTFALGRAQVFPSKLEFISLCLAMTCRNLVLTYNSVDDGCSLYSKIACFAYGTFQIKRNIQN